MHVALKSGNNAALSEFWSVRVIVTLIQVYVKMNGSLSQVQVTDDKIPELSIQL